MLPLTLRRLLIVKLIFAFIFFTIVGTVSHEIGHYLVAKSLGYHASVNYMSMRTSDPKHIVEIADMQRKYTDEINAGKDFPEKERYAHLMKSWNNDNTLITAGGPLQTMLTGTISFGILLLYVRKKPMVDRLSATAWLLVFLSLFWLRQVANMAVGIFYYLLRGFLPVRGDEYNLSVSFELPPFAINLFTGLIGCLLVAYVIIRIIPISQRLSFIIAGLVGGVAGALLWFGWLGPVLLP